MTTTTQRRPPGRQPAPFKGWCSYCFRAISGKENGTETYKHKPTMHKSHRWDLCPGMIRQALRTAPPKGTVSQFKQDAEAGLWPLDDALGVRVYTGPLPRPAASKAGPAVGAPAPAPAAAELDTALRAIRKEASDLLKKAGDKNVFDRDEVMKIAEAFASIPKGPARDQAVEIVTADLNVDSKGRFVQWEDREGNKLFTKEEVSAAVQEQVNQELSELTDDDISAKLVEARKRIEELEAQKPSDDSAVVEELRKAVTELTADLEDADQREEAQRLELEELRSAPRAASNGSVAGLDPKAIVEMIAAAQDLERERVRKQLLANL